MIAPGTHGMTPVIAVEGLVYVHVPLGCDVCRQLNLWDKVAGRYSWGVDNAPNPDETVYTAGTGTEWT